jgi:dehydrogenase/reductase SDR family protein 7B
MYFRHKRIWITGASSGLGEALALELAAQQAHLILSSRNATALQKVANAAAAAGAASVLVQALDLERHETLGSIAQSVLQQVGKIDILVHCGGISQRSLTWETSLEVDKKIMNINYFGTIALTKAVLPSMMTHHLGHIVVISSVTGKIGWHQRSAYSASKHALHGFFDTLRMELRDSPIRITIACPGYIHTQVSVHALRGDGAEHREMDLETARGMAPERAARAILRAVEKDKEEIWFGGRELLGIYLKRFFPKYFSRISKRGTSS